MKKLIVIVMAVAAIGLAVPVVASAYTYDQARTAALIWIKNHCGQLNYKCNWFVLQSLAATGINETGHAQWKFTAMDSESRTSLNPFLPKYLSCFLAGGVGPYGGILNAYKLCSPEG